ncbi:serine kinase [Pukyongiella litopenaei]|uniref:Serine kinase n=2 Tax=Pukyongiella litopenaei TaxID=2605946 RepID=A0A2S0MV58_9RHOB|nr:serine kinase [Pukyongiella litopenaei]
MVHASCVAVGARAVLIRGGSGSGKSALALAMMGLGAALVADDRVWLTRDAGQVIATAPQATAGLIEARGVGILRADALGSAPVVLVADLERTETDRLPHPRTTVLLGCRLPLLFRVDGPHFAPALVQYLKAGRWDDDR